mmetsp:Transcript_55786/g.157146  ORF Transcript_55786/g.157146 Transcript_55786/m.157146 type:complete len:239 (+) Transcript_55786:1984-2700(+)
MQIPMWKPEPRHWCFKHIADDAEQPVRRCSSELPPQADEPPHRCMGPADELLDRDARVRDEEHVLRKLRPQFVRHERLRPHLGPGGQNPGDPALEATRAHAGRLLAGRRRQARRRRGATTQEGLPHRWNVHKLATRAHGDGSSRCLRLHCHPQRQQVGGVPDLGGRRLEEVPFPRRGQGAETNKGVRAQPRPARALLAHRGPDVDGPHQQPPCADRRARRRGGARGNGRHRPGRGWRR